MRIEYINTFLDIFRFNVGHQIRHPLVQTMLVVCAILITFSKPPHENLQVCFLFAALVYSLLWVPQLALLGLYLLVRRDKTVLTSHILDISEQGVRETTPYNSSTFLWSGIVALAHRGSHIAIYVSQNGAHVVPMRAFKSHQEGIEFFQALTRFQNAARGAA